MSGQAQLDQFVSLSRLAQLEWEIRHAANEAELDFIVVNDTQRLLRYDNAVLCRPGRGVVCVSGGAQVDKNAPFVVWLHALAKPLLKSHDGQPRVVAPEDVPGPLRDGFAQWASGALLWVPLARSDGRIEGGLACFRADEWTDAEKRILARIGNAYAHAYALFAASRAGSWRVALAAVGSRPAWLAAAAILVAAMFLPVRLSILAPADVAARQALVATAPLAGVVREVLVEPNQYVEEGQPLFVFDDAKLRTELEMARRRLGVLAADYRRAEQKSFTDATAKAEVALLLAKARASQAEVEYATERLARITVTAPAAGVVLFDSANDWIGRPVALGEKVMTVADPAVAMLDIRIPVGDAIAFEPGAEVLFFLNATPTDPVSASLETVSYSAYPSPDQTIVYRAEAGFEDGAEMPRLGLKGTAKIYGERISLAYVIFRRPLASLRRMLGL